MTDWHPLRSSQQVGTEEWEDLNKAAETLAENADSASMPSLDHLTMKDYDEIYEPAEDTYLLIDAIQHAFQADPSFRPRNALEIGCGSGVPIVFLGQQSKLCSSKATKADHASDNNGKNDSSNAQSIPLTATDINPTALDVTLRTAKQNSVEGIEAVRCDLATSLLSHSYDAILFNPPYVPTPDDEVQGCGIEASWAGGTHGRVVIDRALPQIPQLLSKPQGVCFMITVDDNQPEQIASTLAQEYGLDMRPYFRRRAHNEYLTVQRICWQSESEK
mmetsp:Transcript_18009/g.49958  ORF Transcript_18009/g.49958 Transcript_18009/m.49958 type:complete len:275 (-) Transcript_18009:1349-2173(-)